MNPSGPTRAMAPPPDSLAARLGVLFAAALPLAWLLPQHYLPWLTAHQDFVALALLCLAGLTCGLGGALPLAWALALAIALGSVFVQTLLGWLYLGDATMVALYLLAFGGAISLGAGLARQPAGQRWHPLDLLALATAGAALFSVGVALMQWTGTSALPLAAAAMLPGDRPYANFAQANHFCSATFLGLTAFGWLRESRRIGATGWYFGASMMVLGMVASGSRTAWLQLALMVIAVAWFGRRHVLSLLRLRHVFGLLALFAALSIARPRLDALWTTTLVPTALVAPAGGAGHTELRWPLWQAMVDALSQRPWTGYGWLRVQSAQYEVALEHASIRRYFEYSHNLLLDLAIWVGLPLAALLVALMGRALYVQTRSIVDARALWLMIGVLGLLVHAMLEFPLAYAYFLLPVGLALGALHGLAPAQRELTLSPTRHRSAWLVLGILLLVVAVDYFRVEDNYRKLRVESIFGSRRIETPAPDLLMLTQLEAYLRFIRTEARPGMTEPEVQKFRDVARRFAHPPVLLRLALAEGLNGHPAAAAETLRRLCAMHTAQLCQEGREAWQLLQQRYPVLLEVALP